MAGAIAGAAVRGLGALLLLSCLTGQAGAGVCAAPDAGWGTARVPPDPVRCAQGYRSATPVRWVLDAADPETRIVIDARHRGFFPLGLGNGGRLDGEYLTFDSELELHMTGTGELAGFQRTILVPLPNGEVHLGPRTHGDPVQRFGGDVFRLQGYVIGDRDFDRLELRAGSQLGLPSPGGVELARLGAPGSDFNVHGHFDLAFEVDFEGSPFGALAGRAGTNRGRIRMTVGEPSPEPGPGVPFWAALGPVALLGLVLYRASF